MQTIYIGYLKYRKTYYKIENLRSSGEHSLAYEHYKEIREMVNEVDPNAISGSIKDIIDHKIDYEFSIISYYTNKYKEGIESYKKLFKNNKIVSEHLNKNILSNFRFFLDYVDEEDAELFKCFSGFVQKLKDDNVTLNSDEINIIKKIISNFNINNNKEESESDYSLKIASIVPDAIQETDEDLFCLAQDYFDTSQYEESIETYKKYIELDSCTDKVY